MTTLPPSDPIRVEVARGHAHLGVHRPAGQPLTALTVDVEATGEHAAVWLGPPELAALLTAMQGMIEEGAR